MGLLRSKKSFALEIATKPLIMASEIAGLAPLRGFIKVENHVVPARFRLAKKRNKQPEFLERPREKPLPRKADAVKTSAPPKTPETKNLFRRFCRWRKRLPRSVRDSVGMNQKRLNDDNGVSRY